MPAREKNLVAFTQAIHPSVSGVDVSQSIGRCPMVKFQEESQTSFLPTLTTSTKMFMLAPHCRVLAGPEVLSAQGFPIEEFEKLLGETQPARLHDMAGNAMTCTVVLSVFCAMLLAVPWSGEGGEPPQSSSEDLSVALVAFMQSARPASQSPSQ